jgi:hypothetical protein
LDEPEDLNPHIRRDDDDDDMKGPGDGYERYSMQLKTECPAMQLFEVYFYDAGNSTEDDVYRKLFSQSASPKCLRSGFYNAFDLQTRQTICQ